MKLSTCGILLVNNLKCVTTKLSEVLQVWIDKRTCEVTWRMIITVVKEPPVEKKVVAEKIYQFLARPDIRNEYLPSYQPGKFCKIVVTIVPVLFYRSNDYHF